MEPNGTTDELKPWVTVGDAFSDLPEVFPTADSKYKLVSLNIEYPYKTEAQNEYQKIMRTWYGKEGLVFRQMHSEGIPEISRSLRECNKEIIILRRQR